MKKSSAAAAITFFLLLGSVGVLWAQSYTVNVSKESNGTQYLTDSHGMTLYYFTKDVAGNSECTGGCLGLWPAFNAGTIDVPASLNASDFGTITRADGTQQTTYQGWPLYYFAKDAQPGDMNGQNFHGIWFVETVPSYTVMVATSATLGNYLTDSNGMALYYFTKDSPNTSVCEGKCLQLWPAFYSANLVVPASLNASDFGTITRADGTPQTTYKGYPLYYWVKDTARGQTTGQNVGHIWFVVDPAKFNPAG
ncbi:MAG TPA: hypothetical protein VMW73_06145 [Spirochaetia bacterium]|nr:hypothetical protein [Spirochaetia bacterium]